LTRMHAGLNGFRVSGSLRVSAVGLGCHNFGMRIAALRLLREGLALTACGLALGVAGAFAVTRLMAALLFGVTPRDAMTFIGMVVVMGMVAALASYVPARHSATVDPLVALRHE
jgi:ABC-type antimicrobial peptide transport system permease subunit